MTSELLAELSRLFAAESRELRRGAPLGGLRPKEQIEAMRLDGIARDVAKRARKKKRLVSGGGGERD